ncbi:two-component system, OmpR family, sensor kinase [Sinosporangium album]|uniref:histidine kinase n=1 Tax=Sinosporangium album TaxID=504805 RepID=A0A1G8CL01_9ACTN|nr:HAMP domain-containing sensor histidine kinase [Sinosporangium album]SDH45933.1 two-component system, OmpR family, sensor kinase [Sinosporangium album]
MINRVRRLSARTPLRVKLVAAVIALTVTGLLAVGTGNVSLLRNYLVERVDTRIDEVADRVIWRVIRKPKEDKRVWVPDDAMVRITNASGMEEYFESGIDVQGLPEPRLTGVPLHEPHTVRAVSGTLLWRVKIQPAEGNRTLVVAMTMSEVNQTTSTLAGFELLGGVVVIVLLAGIGAVMVRRSLRPLTEIERTAGAIAAGELSRRVPEAAGDTEVGRLARALNGMLSQIESAFTARSQSERAARRSEERMRQFVADASHELRTPLTSIRGFAEYYRQNPDADTDELMRRVESQAARMGVLVDDLLLLARLDQKRPLDTHPVDLLAVAADSMHDARLLAPERAISLEVVGDEAMIVNADETRLRQVVGNLMSNALMYTPEPGAITIRVGVEQEEAFIEVADEGPGLSPQQAERVFERFYRADSSRARRGVEDGGSGLGLAIVAAIVEAHGGSVALKTTPGSGSTFRVTLPLALD